MSDASVEGGATGTDVPPEAIEEDEKKSHNLELICAIMLGLAGVLAAFAAYKGGLAGGDAIQGYSQATISRNEANGFYADYGQKIAQDQNVFLAYQTQVALGNDDAANIIRERLFSPELETAFVVWVDLTGDDDVPSPLDTEQYVIEDLASYQTNFDASVKQFDDAAVVDDQGDQMDLATVFFAVALFFAGIASLFKDRKVSFAMLFGSAILFVPGCWAIAAGLGWT